jgi:hypothetical protein
LISAVLQLAPEHLLAAAFQPIVAPFHVVPARTKVIELQPAKPAVVKLAAKNPVEKIKDSAAHAINFVDSPKRRNVLIAALGTFGKARQLKPRRQGHMVAGATLLTAIGLEIMEAFKPPALGTT